MRILFVGNSYQYYGADISNNPGSNLSPFGLFLRLLEEAGQDIGHSVSWIPGGTLRQHWNDTSTGNIRDELASGDYDLVVLNGSNNSNNESPEEFTEYSGLIDSLASENGAQSVYSGIWAHDSNISPTVDDFTSAYDTLYREAAVGQGSAYAPIGVAYARLYNELHQLYSQDSTGEFVEISIPFDVEGTTGNGLTSDSVHAGPLVSYLAALVTYATVYNQAAPTSWVPTGISAADAQLAQTIAISTFETHGESLANPILPIATLVGGSNSDTLTGGSDSDLIQGFNLNDNLFGNGGNDSLFGGSGLDLLDGGEGNDNLYGGTESDELFGGNGADILRSGDGNDRLFGGSGADTIYGDDGNDLIYGDDGNDLIFGGNGNDYIYSGTGRIQATLGGGDDYILAGSERSVFYGGGGNDYISYYNSTGGVTLNLTANTASGSWADDDVIFQIESVSGSAVGADNITGTSGANTIRTYGGNDYVYAGNGRDYVSLGTGDDYVRVGGGQETFYGGSGNDYISYYSSTYGVTLNLATNTASGSWANNDIVNGFESVSGSATGSDNITGTSGANTIRTYGGNDYVYAGNGRDYVSLGTGDDYVRAGGGQETFYGGSGTDYISYYSASGGVTLDLQANTASGSWAVNDIVNGFESVSGSAVGADTILGTTGANTIRTYGGNDVLDGRAGNDMLYGGSGSDTFHFDLGGDADVIRDFQNNVDRIEFENFTFGAGEDVFDYAIQVGSDVVFDFGNGDILTVENIYVGWLYNDVIVF